MNHPDRPAGRALSEAQEKAEAERLITEGYSEKAPVATFYRDVSPVPAIGTAPPVQQPGRVPMSQRATDASVLMLAGAGSMSMVSVSTGILMYLSQYADPVVCGVVLGAPTVVVLALCRLARRAKEVVQAAPPVIHQHYEGAVTQNNTEITTNNRGVIARTNNRFDR
ncbi:MULTISPECIES: hypothetical protein [Streptomyces]|uniref:hypothetical protein n=1 Tax=Streptomyces TaxID=1883 RepID=UPI00073DCBB8|nr:hypothetical protein [Streptomyces sp. FBKL.4005]OYP10262.1 hypothetical protein CFC35_41465 [Streptomyces sp. FBKL.4005]CUW33415.1 hypothetical protein TUE45_pSRTUE45a_0047 [Streptomyces reticuli]